MEANFIFGKNLRTCFILIGIQASGKTTFTRRVLSKYEYISLDQLHTRSNEQKALENALKNALIAQSSDYVENSKNRHFPKEENLQCHTKTEENEKGANITQNRKNRK